MRVIGINDLPPELSDETLAELMAAYRLGRDNSILESALAGLIRRIYVWCYRWGGDAFAIGMEVGWEHLGQGLLYCDSAGGLLGYLRVRIENRLRDEWRVSTRRQEIMRQYIADGIGGCGRCDQALIRSEEDEVMEMLGAHGELGAVVRMIWAGWKKSEICDWLTGLGISRASAYRRYAGYMDILRKKLEDK